MVRTLLILGFGLAAFAGIALPWDAGWQPSEAPSRHLPLLMFLVCGLSIVLLLTRRRGSGIFLLAALLWMAFYPLRVVFYEPDHLLTALAEVSSRADNAQLWNAQNLAVGKLGEHAKVPNLGQTPGSFFAAAPEWLAPGYWIAILMVSGLILIALADPRRKGGVWMSRTSLVWLGITVVLTASQVMHAFQVQARWDRSLQILSTPAITPAEAITAREFSDSYPPFLLNETARTLLLRNDIPLREDRRFELSLLAKDWPANRADDLIVELEPMGFPSSARDLALRRLWWGPLSRGWSAVGSKIAGSESLTKLYLYMGDESSVQIWSFLAAWRQGNWEHAAEIGNLMSEDKRFARYHASVAAVMGRLHTVSGNRQLARVEWEKSFDLEPTNNDGAVRGLGVVGP